MNGVRERARERSIVAEAQALRDRCVRGADLALSTADAPTPSTVAEARAQRRELYALLGVCAERVVGDFIAIVPPTKVPSVAWVSPGMTVSEIFTDLLQRTLERFFVEHTNQWRDGERTTSIGPLLARIDQLGPSSSAVLDRPRFHYAEHLLHAGMRTTAPIAPAVMSAIVELRADARTDPNEIAQVARRSVRVALQLASLDLERSSKVQHRLIDADTIALDLSMVHLAGAPGRERLEVDLRNVANDPGAVRERVVPSAYGYTIGCPSLLRLGSTSALEQMWMWTIEVAEELGYLTAAERYAR